MFDKALLYAAPARHEHTHVNVTMVDPSVEKGARFLREVEDKAKERISDALVRDITSITAQVVTYLAERNMPTDTVRQRCVFKINGHVFDVVVESFDHNPEDFAKVLSEKIAQSILAQVVRDPIFHRRRIA